LGGNVQRATIDVLPGIATDDKDIHLKASASILTNSDSVSNEIDESDLQAKKQFEQRI
jgi:hypothetical protein